MKIITLIITLTFLLSCSESDSCVDVSLIEPNKACTKEYRPVCGCNGITYSNTCLAEGAGVTLWTDGECN